MSDRPLAIVTGAGSGIGRAIALELARRDHAVALVGRRKDALEATRALCGDPAVIAAFPTDVADIEQVGSTFSAIAARWNHVDLLVNNAGTFGPSADLEDVTEQQWNQVLAVNLSGALWCTQLAVRAMKQQHPQGGRIINIGSVSARRPRPRSVAYAVSKHGMTGLTRATALEGRDWNISCTQIDVGNAATEMSAAAVNAPQKIAEAMFDANDIGAIVGAIAELPLSTSIDDFSLFASCMPYLGRG